MTKFLAFKAETLFLPTSTPAIAKPARALHATKVKNSGAKAANKPPVAISRFEIMNVGFLRICQRLVFFINPSLDFVHQLLLPSNSVSKYAKKKPTKQVTWRISNIHHQHLAAEIILFLNIKQDQTGLDRSARSTIDFGANTVERYI